MEEEKSSVSLFHEDLKKQNNHNVWKNRASRALSDEDI